jgi:hypothetical protein
MKRYYYVVYTTQVDFEGNRRNEYDISNVKYVIAKSRKDAKQDISRKLKRNETGSTSKGVMIPIRSFTILIRFIGRWRHRRQQNAKR